jgi:hypothetical protein
MTALSLAFVTFVCTFSCALFGIAVRRALPPAHLSKESQDVVRLGMGLVATMTALLLGLVTAAAKGSFDSQDTAFRNAAAGMLSLDRLLARYGPETQPTRELLRHAVAQRLEMLWPTNGAARHTFDLVEEQSESSPIGETIETQILHLRPTPKRGAGSNPRH